MSTTLPRAGVRLSTMASAATVPRVARLSNTLQHCGGIGGRFPASIPPEQALAAGAQLYLSFMSLEQQPRHSQCSEQQDNYRQNVAVRYELFRRLQQKKPGIGLHQSLVPTRDIAAAWAADLLRPAEYDGCEVEHDNMALWYFHQQHRMLQSGTRIKRGEIDSTVWSLGRAFKFPSHLSNAVAGGLAGCLAWDAYDASWMGGTTVGAALGIGLGMAAGGRATKKITGACASRHTPSGLALARFDANGDGIIDEFERLDALTSWQEGYLETERLWNKEHSTLFPSTGLCSYRRASTDHRRSLESDTLWHSSSCPSPKQGMAEAMESQQSFNSKILALGPEVINDDWIQNAVQRYFKFLELAKRHPGRMLVPTLDIDLIWHVHMLSPADYHDDCHAIVGKLLAHDTRHSSGALSTAFDDTKHAWTEAFAEPLVRPPKDQKQEVKQSMSSKAKSWQNKGKIGGHHGTGNSGSHPGGCGVGCGVYIPSRGWGDHSVQLVEKQTMHHSSNDSLTHAWADASIDHSNFTSASSMWTEMSTSNQFDNNGDCGGWGGSDSGSGGGSGGCASSSCGTAPSACAAAACGGCGGCGIG